MALRLKIVLFMVLGGSLMLSGMATAETSGTIKSVSVPTPAAQPAVAATAPAKTETPQSGPCEGFKTSQDAYVICQDRMKKIEAMVNARTQRNLRAEVAAGREKLGVPYPASPQAPTPPQTSESTKTNTGATTAPAAPVVAYPGNPENSLHSK